MNERILKMKTEIIYRLSQAEERLDQLLSNKTMYAIGAAIAPVTLPLSAETVIGPPVFPEFAKRTVKSLLIEWQIIS